MGIASRGWGRVGKRASYSATVGLLVVTSVVSVSAGTLAATAQPAVAALPGHNGLIAWASDQAGAGYSEIWTMNSGGGQQTELTHATTDGSNTQPAWSPNGTKIAFVRSASTGQQVWVMDANGSNQTQVTGGDDFNPTWSPDGQKIAFMRFDGGGCCGSTFDIWVVPAAGGSPTNLTNNGSSEWPSWSPDGTKIAFQKSIGGTQSEIYTMNADGSSQTDITNSPADDAEPDWSPDGTKIAFESSRAGGGIFTMNTDGSGVAAVAGTTGGDNYPAWSPDGTWIAFSSDRDHNEEIYRVRADGSGDATRLTNNAPPYNDWPEDYFPSWQPLSTPPSPTGDYTPLTPARIFDTRDGTGGHLGPIGSGASIDVQITGQGGVPASGVGAVVLNVTVTQPTRPGYLTIWPAGVAKPVISNLNFVPGQTVPNAVTVEVGAGGKVSAFNYDGTTHVVFDVVGYYANATGPTGSRFHGISPARLFDTRDGTGGVPAAPVGPGATLKFHVTGKDGVPASGVTGVVMNVTVTAPATDGYVTVYPDDVSRPLASNLNFVPGQTVPNLVVMRVPASGTVDFFNVKGTTHLIADVVGYYNGDRSTEAGRFVPVTPQRVLDTRELNEPLGPDSGGILQLTGFAPLPSGGVGSVVMNVTVTEPTSSGYVTVFPDDDCLVPLASNLNFVAGQTVPNLVMVRVSTKTGCAATAGAVDFYNLAGTTHVIADVFGYFTDDTAAAPAVATRQAPTSSTRTPRWAIDRRGRPSVRASAPSGADSTQVTRPSMTTQRTR